MLNERTPDEQTIHWTENDVDCSAQWRCERGAAAPLRVVPVDDTITADSAYRLICGGTALLWRGDYQNARQLLSALARRIDKPPRRKRVKAAKGAKDEATVGGAATAADQAAMRASEGFHRHRLAQSQRARTLGLLLVPLDEQYRLALRRAPDVQAACSQAWGPYQSAPGGAVSTSEDSSLSPTANVTSLRELLGISGAFEWRATGVAIAALGSPPNNRIFPHYGVFSPLRGEYIDLVATADLPKSPNGPLTVFDIGTGTGVLAAVLARRGVGQITASDQNERALTCARENLAQLGLAEQVKVVKADLFPPGQAALVVCNPPWIPARPSAPIERAVYDEGGRMLSEFLNGLAAHLTPGGQGWLILSDIAEHLGLRTRAQLLHAIEAAGLMVLNRVDTQPKHPKVFDRSDALHLARAAEVTSLWRLAAKQTSHA